MPESQQPIEGQELMITDILSGPCERVLDVGAGDGKWGRLLKGRVGKMAAIEIWPDYVFRHRLTEIYDVVNMLDARKFGFWSDFDVIILGDVLEHMPRSDALTLTEKLRQEKARVYLTVPISPCPQNGLVYGNSYETHLYQWTHGELDALGWKLLHRGLNPNGKVEIGTYIMGREANGTQQN